MDNSVSSDISLLPLENIFVYDSIDKATLFPRMIAALALSPALAGCADELAYGIAEREKLMSTGIGRGLGIPHVRLKSAGDMALGAALVRDGVSGYDGMDGQPVRLVIMIVGREDQQVRHLRLLSRISSCLQNREKWAAVLAAKDASGLRRELTDVLNVPRMI